MRKNALGIPGIDMFATSRRIGELIDQSAYSDRALSEILGLSVQAINKWRHGRNLPDLENLFILSKLFGIPMDAFLVAADEEALQRLARRAGVKLTCLPPATIRRIEAYKRRGTMIAG